MSDHDERTEQPTPYRRDEARAEGRVARSREVVVAGSLLGGFLAMRALAPMLWDSLHANLVGSLSSFGDVSALRTVDGAVAVMTGSAIAIAALAIPVVGTVLFSAVALNVIQGAGALRPAVLTPRLARIDPLQGVQRIVGPRAVTRGVLAIAKTAAVGWLLWTAIARFVSAGPAGTFDDEGGLKGALAVTGDVVVDFGVALGSILLVVAALDYVVERWLHERSLRMSPQEVREESSSLDGDPSIKRQRRRFWLRLLRQGPPAGRAPVEPPSGIEQLRR